MAVSSEVDEAGHGSVHESLQEPLAALAVAVDVAEQPVGGPKGEVFPGDAVGPPLAIDAPAAHDLHHDEPPVPDPQGTGLTLVPFHVRGQWLREETAHLTTSSHSA